MGLRHRTLPVFGVQFHPESIAREHGHALLGNFLAHRARQQPARPAPPDADPRVSNNLKPLLARLAAGETLTAAEAEAAFDIIMSGEATPAQIGGLLMAMRVRGETVAELTGAVRAMRARMTAIEAPDGRDRRLRHRRRQRRHAERVHRGDLRGGRRRGAGGQARQPRAVLAHRRAPTCWPRSGSTSMRRWSGCPASCARPTACSCSRRATTRRCATPPARASSWAPARSSTCSARWPIRRGCAASLTGVFDPAWARPMAETLARAGQRGGVDGARPGPGRADGRRRERGGRAARTAACASFTVTPEDAGLPRAPIEAIRGGDAAANAAGAARVAGGRAGPVSRHGAAECRRRADRGRPRRRPARGRRHRRGLASHPAPRSPRCRRCAGRPALGETAAR